MSTRRQHSLMPNSGPPETRAIRNVSFLDWELGIGSRGKESACQCRRPGLDPWVWKIPLENGRPPTPVFMPCKSHGQGILVGYSPWDHKELDITEWPTLFFLLLFFNPQLCVSFHCIQCGLIQLWHVHTTYLLFGRFFAIEVIAEGGTNIPLPKIKSFWLIY